jgi:hypothetical protein
MLYFLPIVLFTDSTFIQYRFSFQYFNFDVDVYLLPFGGVNSTHQESVCDSRFEKLEESYGTSDVYVLYSEGAHLEEILFQIIVCHFVLVGADILEKLLS